MEGAGEAPLVRCPVCLRELPGADINVHLDECLQAGEDEREPGASPPSKRPRFAAAPPGEGKAEAACPAAITPVCSLFHKSRARGQSPGAPGRRSGAGREEAIVKPEEGGSAETGGRLALSGASLMQRLEGKPLAEQLRPDTLGDYVGQERVLGAQTLLRSLLESHEVPSLILWGPPGCGKVSAAARPHRCACPVRPRRRAAVPGLGPSSHRFAPYSWGWISRSFSASCSFRGSMDLKNENCLFFSTVSLFLFPWFLCVS